MQKKFTVSIVVLFFIILLSVLFIVGKEWISTSTEDSQMFSEQFDELKNDSSESVIAETPKNTTESDFIAVASTSIESDLMSVPLVSLEELKRNVYFAKVNYGSNIPYLVDVKTGEKRTFIPSGYHLVDDNANMHETLPQYLILQRENKLYSYSINNQKLEKINIPLKKSEVIRLYPSMSEKYAFILVITELDLSIVNKGLSGDEHPVVNTRTLHFNAITNRVETRPNIVTNKCFEYDSQNARLFTWACGEGIGQTTPLMVADESGKDMFTVVDSKEFDFAILQEMYPEVHYNDGLFFVKGSGNVTINDLYDNEKNYKDEIVVVDPLKPEPQKQKFSLEKEYGKKAAHMLSHTSVYSLAMSETHRAIVVGSSDRVLIFWYNDAHEIIDGREILEDNVYANFMYINKDSLYYQLNDGTIRVIDLRSGNIERSILSERAEEFSLISFI